jgi:hypothetical protein
MAASKPLLQASDFRYLGMFSVGPDPAGARWGFSLGAMTARRFQGGLRLIIPGSAVSCPPDAKPHHIYEIEPPATFSFDHRRPTYARFVKNWGNVYPVGLPTGNAKGGWGRGSEVQGLFWDDEINGFWYAYGDSYNVGGFHDPSIGCAVVDDRTGAVRGFGPWRTQDHGQRTQGYMVRIPQAFSETHCSGFSTGHGARLSSGNVRSPWGPALFASERLKDYSSREPDRIQSTPTEPINAPTGLHPRYSIATRVAMFSDYDHKKPREANYEVCDWKVKYDCTQGSSVSAGAPAWTDVDTCSAATWIDLPDKFGLVYFASLVWPNGRNPVPHKWYGPAGPCCHGQRDPYQLGTGPGSGGKRPFWYVYDPADLVPVLHGTRQPWAVPNHARIDAYAAIHGNDPYWDTTGYYVTGAWVDPVDRRLYLCERDGDAAGVTSQYEGRPMIHVFEIR